MIRCMWPAICSREHGEKFQRLTMKRVFDKRKFLSDHYMYAHTVIFWHHQKTRRWSRTSFVDELVVRMVTMRGPGFSYSGLALHKATVIHPLTRRTRLPTCGVTQLSRRA